MRLIRAGNQKNIRGRLNLQRLQPPVVSSVSYLLDTYPAFAAYSTRLLSGSYAGSCLRVREDGTNTETDIDFVEGWLDEAAIASHCGANNGYVVTWYDQSGNGYDATEATTSSQPQIYNGSAVLKINSKPAITPSSLQRLKTGSFTTQTVANTIFSVGELGAGGYLYSAPSPFPHTLYSQSNSITMYNGVTLSTLGYDTSQTLYSALWNGASSLLRVNSSEVMSGDAGSSSISSITLLNADGGGADSSYMQEYVFFNSDQTANFAAIEADINAAFSIY